MAAHFGAVHFANEFVEVVTADWVEITAVLAFREAIFEDTVKFGFELSCCLFKLGVPKLVIGQNCIASVALDFDGGRTFGRRVFGR